MDGRTHSIVIRPKKDWVEYGHASHYIIKNFCNGARAGLSQAWLHTPDTPDFQVATDFCLQPSSSSRCALLQLCMEYFISIKGRLELPCILGVHTNMHKRLSTDRSSKIIGSQVMLDWAILNILNISSRRQSPKNAQKPDFSDQHRIRLLKTAFSWKHWAGNRLVMPALNNVI